MKMSELTGALLDLWVARAMKLEPIPGEPDGFFYWKDSDEGDRSGWWCPSTDWRQAGPIIERERVGVMPVLHDAETYWLAAHPGYGSGCAGSTPLIAAMRAYVASVYGDTVPDQPEEERRRPENMSYKVD